ncbi:MAG: hypothetical protein ACI8Q1_001278 [Parvicella sp.]|jgi:hypothetical protein
MKKEDKNINPFKLINKVDQLPPELKKEVMATISYAHLMTDIGKLFSVDLTKTAGKMINPFSEFEEES